MSALINCDTKGTVDMNVDPSALNFNYGGFSHSASCEGMGTRKIVFGTLKNSMSPGNCTSSGFFKISAGTHENAMTTRNYPSIDSPKVAAGTHNSVVPWNYLSSDVHGSDVDDNSGYVHVTNPWNLQMSNIDAVDFPVGDLPQYVSPSFYPQAQACPYEFQFQEFQYFVVIDFEATCDKERNPHPQEIIEFPSVIVNSLTGQLEACFQTYVRPTFHPVLSDFCKELTGIQQSQVDKGVSLSEALLMHDKWLQQRGIMDANFAVVTWSNWDCQVALQSECRYKKIQKPHYFNRWINLKVPFRELYGSSRCNLKDAVQRSGLVWQGRPHCGLDDAKNTACLLLRFMHHGFRFSITNSLWWSDAKCQSAPASEPHPNRTAPVLHAQSPKSPQMIHPRCFCGVRSSTGVICKPGSRQGSLFFRCGNCIAGARCHYFQWASPES